MRPSWRATRARCAQALFNVRALIAPPSVALDAQALHFAPVLRAVGRLSAGAENLDVEAFARAGVEIVRPGTASAGAEAEFAIGAMLQLLRRVPVRSTDGMLVGRELAGATVGLVGMPAAARPLAEMLGAFGAQVKGYDPAVHMSDGALGALEDRAAGPARAGRAKRRGVRAAELLHAATRACSASVSCRYCKPDQVLVSLAHSSLFDEAALAEALDSRPHGRGLVRQHGAGHARSRPAAAPRCDNLQVTPRVAGTTRESRIRSAWAVARRIDEILSEARAAPRVQADDRRRLA